MLKNGKEYKDAQECYYELTNSIDFDLRHADSCTLGIELIGINSVNFFFEIEIGRNDNVNSKILFRRNFLQKR